MIAAFLLNRHVCGNRHKQQFSPEGDRSGFIMIMTELGGGHERLPACQLRLESNGTSLPANVTELPGLPEYHAPFPAGSFHIPIVGAGTTLYTSTH